MHRWLIHHVLAAAEFNPPNLVFPISAVILRRLHRTTVGMSSNAVIRMTSTPGTKGMGDRVVHRAGDALADDLGIEAWDLVFVAQLLHHFDDATNRELARRVSRALRPGGIFVIQEAIRPASPDRAGQTGALLDLYFALTSEAGTWSFEEKADWQREAGLEPKRPIRFRTVPGVGQQAAVKPRA